VQALVAVFREVRRVLRDDGTVWLNLGDSYNAYNGNRGPAAGLNAVADVQRNAPERGLTFDGCKPKDLIGIPWMVAFALRTDGWYLRSDIIWAKTNPMPESVTDRPTKAHEYVFLLSKGPRYFYDAEAVRVSATSARSGRSRRSRIPARTSPRSPKRSSSRA
jgi:site-specific DNA-methyltransferase (cytosine-N4-specific)